MPEDSLYPFVLSAVLFTVWGIVLFAERWYYNHCTKKIVFTNTRSH
jgi:hypothetical protein